MLHPVDDTEVDAQVLKVNKMGAYAVAAVFEETMRILLPRDLHSGSEEFDALKVGDTIRVRILRSRFQTTPDPFIVAIGTLRGSATPK
jgi:hypothetical protein